MNKTTYSVGRFYKEATDCIRHEPDFVRLANNVVQKTEIMTKLEKWYA